MSRVQTENEYIGKLLEYPVTYVLKFLKEKGVIKNYWSSVPLRYGGDLDHIIELHDRSFVHIADMNFNTKYSYTERASRIKNLPKEQKTARKMYGKVHKTVLIITDCLKARPGWLKREQIEPIIIGQQIREIMEEKRLVSFCKYLSEKLKGIIQRIEKKIILESRKSSFSQSFAEIRLSFVRLMGSFGKALKSDAIKWRDRFKFVGAIKFPYI